MPKFCYSFLMIVLILAIRNEALCQNYSTDEPVSSAEMGDANPFQPVAFENGIRFEDPNKLFGMVLRFRIQNRADFQLLQAQDQLSEPTFAHQWIVRRSRLRFNGYILNPRWRYLLQLSFSRRDQDWDESQVPNLLRDALILYDISDNWTLAFGQGKLPGNRQRVISSGDLQFVDRSLFNASFNIDRDFGFQTQYRLPIVSQPVYLKAAITSGEGRNENSEASERFFYTARVEWNPFGDFSRGGDYFESDLMFEPELKVATGFSYANLLDASRANGAIGTILTTDGDRESLGVRRSQVVKLFDVIAKYQGASFLLEVGQRSARNPIVNATQALLVGWGGNVQIGQMLTQIDEIAVRHSWIDSSDEVRRFQSSLRDWTLVYNRFLNGHRLKLQGEVGLIENREQYLRLQLELGI